MSKRIVVLLSDGIDSPVAAHLLAEAGAEVNLLYLDRFGDEDLGDEKDHPFLKIKSILDKLEKLHGDIELYRGEYSKIMRVFTQNVDTSYTCLLCRRMMYRVAEKLADEVGAVAIATGESLGQVASQTLGNLQNEDEAADIPVIRPLIGLDKNEVINIAKEIETFDISISKSFDCPFTPPNPAVTSSKKKIHVEEERFDIDALIADTTLKLEQI